MAVGRLLAHAGLHGRARQEPERYDGLEKAGFKLERDGEIMHNLFERYGGHYMDVGASAKIAKGLVFRSTSFFFRFLQSRHQTFF